MLPEQLSALSSSFSTAASQASIFLPQGVKSFKEMGIFGWFLVDLAINWAGWAVAAALKVGSIGWHVPMHASGAYLGLPGVHGTDA